MKATKNSRPQDHTIPQCLLQCICPTTPCTCLAKLRPYILCLIGVPIDCPPPLRPTSTQTIQFIHTLLPRQILTCGKIAKYNPLIHTLRRTSWQVISPITITTCVRGSIHKQLLKELEKLKNTQNRDSLTTLMKHLHQIAIKYLTYLVLNTRMLDNKQPLVDPP